ncbi:hypothetical protein B0A49_00150 [Cryomyces minteri]|uniref:Major facilitator superfamily (MFS) profile domain-containing protein n=1 Tax=Cryomyces minteri TaxID=331657 RepID=A0A4U0XYB5_9PEZI|nr:hypothetical protein B0A49_00150 [Cryomyces minteri]
MQSYLQYRRFRTAVIAQRERDQEKAAGLRTYKKDAQSPNSSEASHATDDHRDLEKAEGSTTGFPEGVRPGELRHEPGKEESTRKEEEATLEDDLRGSESEDDDPDDDPDLAQAALSRVSSIKSNRSAGTALGMTMTGIQVRKRSTREGGEGQVFVVGYEGENDPMNPHNWGITKRICATMMVASIGFVVGLASAIDASAVSEAAKEFGVSEVVESLATGLYLVGFGVGALFAGPVSETLGRNPVYISTLTLYMIFVMASGLAPNIGAQLAFRFLAGFFGSTPLTCAGGSISDLWSPMERVFAFPVFANAAFTGPLMGPVMGGFIVQSSLISWRWVEWSTLITSGLVFGLVILFQPETYPLILLKWKASHLRAVTGDDRYKAEVEIRMEPFIHRLKRALYRPFLLTSREPIIILIALYLTVIYVVLFTFLDGYTYIFTEIHGTSEGITGLCFLGIVVGLFGASALVPLIYRWAKRDLQKIKEQGGDRLPPEFRLWFAMLGGAFAIPISLFWMGWTSYPSISIWSPLAASALFGYGILCIFISSYQYVIDSYESFAASALVAVTLIRYIAAGGMAVVGIPFYKNMGVQYTLTIMACISALLVPLPYVFYKYGHQIRRHSKYAIKVSSESK